MKTVKNKIEFFLIAVFLMGTWTAIAPPYVYGWTDNTIASSTPIRAIHIQEIRNAVNAKRFQCGIPAAGWTDSTLTPSVTAIRRTHIVELRTAIENIYNKNPARPLGFTWADSNIVAGSTAIRTVHITQLRTAITNATCCGDGIRNSPWEQCDDGNLFNGDGCSSICRIEVIPPCPNGICDVAGGECSTCPADCAGYSGCVNPCDDNTCNLSVDCDCPDGHGDCTVAQCSDPCDDNTCDPAIDCNCSSPIFGDCASQICTFMHCVDGVCNPAEDCSCSGFGDCTSAQCACGNGTCDAGETCNSCPQDCPVCCGDGFCSQGSGQGEHCGSCPQDCGPCCPNGTCGPLESCSSCPQDCPNCCNDGICDPATDCGCANNGDCTSAQCPTGPVCGNGIREGTEQCDDGNSNNCDACTNSCQLGNTCGDGIQRCGEQCDSGAGNGAPCLPGGEGGSCTYCSASCTNVTVQNGGWCPWGPWSEWEEGGCGWASPCGWSLGERRTRTRQCNCPAPANGGTTCPGLGFEMETSCYQPRPICPV